MIGILGGMGPQAGLELGKRIIEATNATLDQEHVPFILYSIPQISDRTRFLLGDNSRNPADQIITLLQQMAAVGVTDVGIACNTCHAPQIVGEIQRRIASLNLPLVIHSAVSATIAELGPGRKDLRVGVLSTLGCYRARVYESALREAGIEQVVLEDNDVDQFVHESIYNVEWGLKANSREIAKTAVSRLNLVIEYLVAHGVNCVLLACSELPLALPYLRHHDVNFVDPMQCLARSLVEAVAPGQLRFSDRAESPSVKKAKVESLDGGFLHIPRRRRSLSTLTATPQEYVTPEAPRPMQ